MHTLIFKDPQHAILEAKKMSQKKVVGRSVAIALGVACMILVIGLAGAVAYYTMMVNNKNADYDNIVDSKNNLETWLAGNITQLNSQYNTLNTVYQNYMSTHNHTNSEYDSLQSSYYSLQSSYNALRAPLLIGILSTQDSRPWYSGTSLHVYGNVVNVGRDTAYNAVLYVEAFQGAVLTFNTTISLGTIPGASFATYVDSSISYTGNALTQWHIWSQPAGIQWTWYP
jgi:hypothetical protein